MRSITMNALRSPSASEIHSPPPASGSPAPAVCVSRHVPGCGSPIVNGGPVQSGSRQSAPARKEWIVGVTGRGRHRLVQRRLRQHQRHRRLDHGLRAKARHARIRLRDPRHRHARQPQRRHQPHRHAQPAARELRDAHRLDRERLAAQLDARPSTARSPATRCSTCDPPPRRSTSDCGPERRPRPAAADLRVAQLDRRSRRPSACTGPSR